MGSVTRVVHEVRVKGVGARGDRTAHRLVRSSFFSSVIDSMSGLGASPVLHTSRPKFTVCATHGQS